MSKPYESGASVVRSRRAFIVTIAGGVVAALAAPRGLHGATAPLSFAHPDPRPHVNASNVLATDAVRPEFAELFDGIREIPHIADGIGCHCGCGAMPEMRSLLSCYEGMGMAQFCVVCSGEGRLAIELHAQGRTLDEIRTAIDRRFG